MLGTDKQQLLRDGLSEDLAPLYDQLGAQEAIDREEQFLQMTALAANYRRCGLVPQQQLQLTEHVAPEETLPYCKAAAAQTLKAVLDEENKGLLELWLQLCVQHRQIAPPALLPQLFYMATKHKVLYPLAAQCAGNRGAWLASFNKDWQTEAAATGEDLWETGTPDQRKEVLQQLRGADPAGARERLQAVWKQETANVRAELLQVFFTGLSAEDLPWLEELTTDKSQRVKEAAFALLGSVPASSVVQRYLEIAGQAVVMKKERTMLGLSSKMVLQVQLPAGYDETIHKTGIEKTTAARTFTNEEWIVYQLIAAVPPQSWETYFNDTAENIAALFSREKSTEMYLPALAAAAGKFKDLRWAKALAAADPGRYYEGIVPLLEPAEKESYLLAHIDRAPDDVIDRFTAMDREWSKDAAMAVFRYTAEAPYVYNRSFYNKYIHLFPQEVATLLEQIEPKDSYYRSTWENTRDQVIRLLSLKQQIQQSF